MKPNSLKFIGITGGIVAGKSELLQYIGKHYKCEIYLSDSVAHEVKAPGTKCHQKLLELLGEEIAGPGGQIDKTKMAARIFSDEGLLKQVIDMLHPAVREYLLKRLERARQIGKTELFFVEAALLIECGYGALTDEMWYVYADEKTRRKRLRESRGYSEERINGIMSSQLSEEQFRAGCDFVIDNSGTLAESFAQIDKKLEAFTWQE